MTKQINHRKMSANNEKFSLNSFPFIMNKAYLSCPLRFSPELKRNKKIQSYQ